MAAVFCKQAGLAGGGWSRTAHATMTSCSGPPCSTAWLAPSVLNIATGS